ncbi:hypothetical protein KAW38_03445 [Candidatus Micrarchaeota archaeon]|nr:hypothetical protein [Candidatus Micrarchaeota archaeon]
MAKRKQKPLKNKKLAFIPSKTPKIAQVILKKKLNYTKLFEKHYPKEFEERCPWDAKQVKIAWINFAKQHKLNERNFLRLIPVVEIVLKNTTGHATKTTFYVLSSLLKNRNFKLEYLSTIETITKNTVEDATESTFHALDSLLKNPNFKPEYFPAIETITKNTTGDATPSAFYTLNSLLKNKNFKPDWIEKHWSPVFNSITKNTTTGYATESAFYTLNSLLKNKNFKPDWIEKHWSPVFNSITKNTTEHATESAFYALRSLLKNTNFKPEYLPAIETITKNTTGYATESAFYALNSLLKDTNFKPEYFSAIETITKNTTGYATGYAFDALNSLLKDTNFKPEYLNSLLNNESLLFTVLFSTYPASIELGKPLDTLHNDSTKRKQYLNSLTKYQITALLLSDPEYFYTSSNKMLVERFQSDLKKGEYKINEKIIMTHPFFSYSKDPYLLLKQLTLFDNELGKEKLRNLTARLITYDLFTGEKGVFSEENAGKLINVFIEPIEKLKLEDNYLFLLGNMIERLEKGENIELIKRKLEENFSKTKGKNKKAFEFLLTITDKNTTLVSEEKKKKISKLIQERSIFRPQKFVSKGKFTVVQVFGKEGGLWSGTYQGLKRNFKLKETLSETKGKRRLNEKTGKIILENDKARFILIRGEPEETEKILKQTIKENPNGVYLFRGHSYNLTKYFPTKIFNENGAKNILFFPGSCGSSSAIPEYLKNNKSITNFLANRRIGEAGVSRYIAQEMAKHYSRTTKPVKFSNFLLKRARQLEKRKGDIKSMSYGSFGEILISHLYSE